MRAVRTSLVTCTSLLVLTVGIVYLVFRLGIFDKQNVQFFDNDFEVTTDYASFEFSELKLETTTQRDNDSEIFEEKIEQSKIPVLTNLTSIKELITNNTDVQLNFTQMAANLGYECLEYDVETQDGYLLKVFRVKASTGAIPVILLHGFFDSADSFILRGANSLVAALYAAGFDVWIVNFRGNKYSHSHVSLDPDTDNSFWSFSFHEHGVYDLPSVIDFVLNVTERERVKIVAYSQSSTVFFVMSNEMPEYNDKVELLLLMAPICHLDHSLLMIPSFAFSQTIADLLLSTLGSGEIFSSFVPFDDFMKKFCTFGLMGPDRCSHGYVLKEESDEIKFDFSPMLYAHYPAGTSIKNLKHFLQLITRKSFAQYDYGFLQNIFVYGSPQPPQYVVSKTAAKIAMIVARNDKISAFKDAEVLRRELPNVTEYRVVHRRKFNHVDYIWGQNVHRYLYPQVVELLNKYNY